MRLYGFKTSPYVQRALMAARLKGQDLVPETAPGGHARTPEFQAISPAARAPLLEVEPGRYLCESEAIAAYFDETFDGPSILGVDTHARAHARQIAALAQHELGSGTRPVVVYRVLKFEGSAETAAAGREQIARGLDAIERVRDPRHGFAAGNEPGWADCMLTPMLVMVALAESASEPGEPPLIAARTGITGYLERARRHPIVGRSIAEMEQGFAAVRARLA